MKKPRFNNLILLIAIFVATSYSAFAQINKPSAQGANFSEGRRPNLLQELSLSKEQVRQLREINQSLQGQRQQAQRQFNQANKALDEAVYADEFDESLVKERENDVQRAHSELIRLRTLMDTSVRKILTKEQLVKFKQLRKQFRPNQDAPTPSRLNQNRRNQPKRP